ncbi:MAG: hypothetical protein P9X24_06245 [Candidatus Hatepunaea meridiana]|nr:hypothetical protein [Candidatus Hatepunaea meridiana]
MKQTLLIFLLLLISGCGISTEKAMEKGLMLFDADQKREAYPYLEKAYSGGTEDPELFCKLAFCRIAVTGDPSGAIDLLRDNVVKFPDYAPTYHQLGLIAYEFDPVEDNKNLHQAIFFARKAVKFDPYEWSYCENLGTYLYLIGEKDSALVWFKSASELNLTNDELVKHINEIEKMLEGKNSSE